jgi:hypothetical protein
MAHYGVKNDFKMLTYYLYAPLFQLFLPCTALIYHLFQQALKTMVFVSGSMLKTEPKDSLYRHPMD